MVKKNKHDKTLISLQVEKETLENWDDFCLRNDKKRSELIREAVDIYIENYNKKPIEETISDILYTQKIDIIKKINGTIIEEFNQIKRYLLENSME